jgi:pantetheine-phosphate adenylyltransferase
MNKPWSRYFHGPDLPFEIETLFVMPREAFSYTSSSLVKQVAKLGADVAHFVPPEVLKALREIYPASR